MALLLWEVKEDLVYTCRECKSSQEFLHYNADLPAIEVQNLHCCKHGTVEPVWNWASHRGIAASVLRKVEAPRCFQAKRRR